jgi:thymidylate synthase
VAEAGFIQKLAASISIPNLNPSGQGVDQLKDVVHKLIHNPFDRRIIMSAWNPADERW